MAKQEKKPVMAATPKMGAVGIDWLGVDGMVQHIINTLNNEGPAAAKVVADFLRLIQGVTDRNLSAIITALVAGETDIAKIVTDIRTEFGI